MEVSADWAGWTPGGKPTTARVDGQGGRVGRVGTCHDSGF